MSTTRRGRGITQNYEYPSSVNKDLKNKLTHLLEEYEKSVDILNYKQLFLEIIKMYIYIITHISIIYNTEFTCNIITDMFLFIIKPKSLDILKMSEFKNLLSVIIIKIDEYEPQINRYNIGACRYLNRFLIEVREILMSL